MVSPFLSFATGALEAVRSKQEADAEAERKRVEREQEIEDLKDMEEFKLKIKREMKSAEQEFQIPGTSIKVQKGKNDTDRYINVVNALSDPNNEDEINSVLNDPSRKRLLATFGYQMISQVKSRGLFQREQNINGVNVKVPLNDFNGFFPQIGQSNPKLGEFFRRLEDNGLRQDNSIPSGTTALIPTGKNKIRAIQIPQQVSPATKNFWKNSPKLRKNAQFNEAETTRKLVGLIGEYNKEAKPYEGNNKFWTAASNPKIMNFLSRKYVGKDETVDFLNTMKNPELGFFEINNMGVTKPNQNFYKFINIFSVQNELVSEPESGFTGSQARVDFRKDSETRELVQNARSISPLITEATMRLEKYYDLVTNNPNIAAGFSRSFAKSAFGIPATIKSIGNIASQALSSFTRGTVSFGEGGKLGTFQLDKNRAQKGAINRSQTKLRLAVETLSNKNALPADIAAARADVFEISLLYQLAAIYQGGTGGRTISDQDIENMKLLIGSNVTSLGGKQTAIRSAFISTSRMQVRNDIALQIKNGMNLAQVDKYKSMINTLPKFNLTQAIERTENELNKDPRRRIGTLNPNTILSSLDFESSKQFMRTYQNFSIPRTGGLTWNSKDTGTAVAVDAYIDKKFTETGPDKAFRFRFGFVPNPNQTETPYLYSVTKGDNSAINLNTGKEVTYSIEKVKGPNGVINNLRFSDSSVKKPDQPPIPKPIVSNSNQPPKEKATGFWNTLTRAIPALRSEPTGGN